MWRMLMLPLLAVVISGGQCVWGQESPLKISIRGEWDGARSSAPLCLRAFLKWPKPELLEGNLQFNTFVDQQQISHWTSPETALSDSEQFLWFMTPRPLLRDKYERYVLEAEFMGCRHHFPPEQLDVEVPLQQKRVMVVGIVVDNRSPTPTGLTSELSTNSFERPLTLQGYLATEDSADLKVNLARVSPTDLPAESLRYLGLDALLIPHDMLNQLRATQLEALRVWVTAGGSLAVIETGKLRSGAAEFVTGLSTNVWTSSQKSERGIPDSIQVYSPGLGQFIHATEAVRGDSKEWERIAHLLLRVTPDRAQEMETSGLLSLRVEPVREGPRRIVETGPVIEGTLEPLARFDYQRLSRLLIPSSIRGMPLGLAAMVLAGCLICIGPVDYFLLGVFRKRRWTWVFFPLVALGFTGWMAHLAAEHNGRNDSRNWISVVDVTSENQVARTSRIELTFGASGRTVMHDVKGQWWADLRDDELLSPEHKSFVDIQRVKSRFSQNSNSNRNPTQDHGSRLAYVGAVPGHYLVEEPVRQWTPRMQRITTLGADPELAEYKLPQLDWSQCVADNPSAVSTYLRQHLPAEWQAASWMLRSPTRETGWVHLAGNESLSTRTGEVLDTTSNMLGESWRPVDIQAQSSPPIRGVFSLLSELSPTAAPDCEDLVMTSRPTLVLVNEVVVGRFLVLRVVFPPE